MTTTVYVLEDDPTLLSALQWVLERAGYEPRVFDRSADLLKAPLSDEEAIAILDLRLPLVNGLEVQNALRERGFTMPCVFISGDPLPDQIIAAMRDRNTDFLLKPFSEEQLLGTVAEALDRHRRTKADRLLTSELERKRLELRNAAERLSPREREILDLVMQGLTNREIGKRLSIKTDTAKKHRTAIFEKLEVENLPGLLDRYVRVA